MRIVSRPDSNGDVITGYLAEDGATNLCLQSQTFNSATWVKVFASAPTTSVLTPLGTPNLTTVTLHEDATAAENHYAYQSIAVTNGTKYCLSIWTKAANRSWLRMWGTGVTSQPSAYYDLSTPAVGTTANVTESGVEDWGNGWVRCWLTFTADTTGPLLWRIFAAEGDGDAVFDGLDQDSLYLFGAQIEASIDYPSSYILTTGSTATRVKDELRFEGLANLGGIGSDRRGRVECDILIGNQNSTAVKNPWDITDGGSGGERLNMAVSTADKAQGFVRQNAGTEVSITDAVIDIADGAIHEIAFEWRTDRARQLVDGAEDGTVDVVCEMPDDLDRIDVGMNLSSGGQLNGVISNLRISNR
jgi:hypothetical protein